jgi:RNase P subunit RPR2
MSYTPLILFLVILITLFINYKNNRCPNCNKWQVKGFNRLDDETIGDVVRVYCPRCQHDWTIEYKKSEFQPKRETIEKD